MKRCYGYLSFTLGILGLTVATAQAAPSVAERVVIESPYAIKADAEADAFVTATAEKAIAEHCTSCHGADLHGKPGVPDLTDYEFIWGVTGEETSGDDQSPRRLPLAQGSRLTSGPVGGASAARVTMTPDSWRVPRAHLWGNRS